MNVLGYVVEFGEIMVYRNTVIQVHIGSEIHRNYLHLKSDFDDRQPGDENPQWY